MHPWLRPWLHAGDAATNECATRVKRERVWTTRDVGQTQDTGSNQMDRLMIHLVMKIASGSGLHVDKGPARVGTDGQTAIDPQTYPATNDSTTGTAGELAGALVPAWEGSGEVEDGCSTGLGRETERDRYRSSASVLRKPPFLVVKSK